ncbi:MAG: AAA family ATPase, partial [Angustibacter sp.]
MQVAGLQLQDFRSYHAADIRLQPGVCVFIGANGHGKTN